MKYTWSIHDKNWAVKEEFLNFDNMSIFNKGVILREIKAGELWEAEIAQTTPLPNSLVVSNTVFLQEKNSLNYSFQRDLFYSQPEAFIQSIGYKIVRDLILRQKKIQFEDVNTFVIKWKESKYFSFIDRVTYKFLRLFQEKLNQKRESVLQGLCSSTYSHIWVLNRWLYHQVPFSRSILWSSMKTKWCFLNELICFH